MPRDWTAELEALRARQGVASETIAAARQAPTPEKLLVDHVQEYAIFLLDAEGRIVSWNPGAERIKQFTRDEVLGHHFRMLYTPDDRQAGRPEKNLADAMRHGQTEDLGWRMKKDGTLYWADSVITAIRDDDGHLIGFAKVVRDLTGANRAQRQAYESELARGLEQLKRQFLALVSHELRTPLTTIEGFAALLEEGDMGVLTPTQHTAVETILRGAEALRRLIDDLLAITSLHAGTLQLHVGPMNFAAVAQGAVFAVQARAQEKHLWLASQVPPGLPDMVADPQRVGQILISLLDNAVKFTPEGGRVEVRAAIDGQMLRCEVSDTGPGIPLAQLERLFQDLTPGDMSSTRAHGGLGIGLALSKRLIEAHGGTIGVLTSPGTGTTVWFTLPLAATGPRGASGVE